MCNHPGFSRVCAPHKLTIGLLTPIEGYPDSFAPSLVDHVGLAQLADSAGFAALRLRDVPFHDPGFGDVGQVFDAMVYTSWLASATRDIAVGTAGVVLPLREPIVLAKQAASIDQLSGGRFLLGIASGDRSVEFRAFGMPFEDRATSTRTSWRSCAP